MEILRNYNHVKEELWLFKALDTSITCCKEIALTSQWLQKPSEQRTLARWGKGLKFKFKLALLLVILITVLQEDL